MAIAQFVVTTLVALIGLYLAHSYRRQQRLRIAERRLDAYGALWKLMEVARPTRIAADASVDRAHGALTRNEAVSLYKSMTHWYFGSANGLLLPDATKRLYLEVKSRLGEYAEGRDSAAEEQGKRRMTEIGLLRAQMRLDLDIYSEPYLSSSNPKNKELERKLLEAAKIDSRGWGVPPWRTRVAERIRQTARHFTAGLPPHVATSTRSERAASEAPAPDTPPEARSLRPTSCAQARRRRLALRPTSKT